MKLINRYKLLKANQKGSIAVEVALIFTAFFAVAILVVDIATIINASIQLTTALRSGSRYIVSQTEGQSDIPNIVKNATDLPAANVTVTTTQFCECNGSGIVCTASCSGGTKATYMTITAQYSVPLIFNYLMVSNPFPLTKTTTVRTK